MSPDTVYEVQVFKRGKQLPREKVCAFLHAEVDPVAWPLDHPLTWNSPESALYWALEIDSYFDDAHLVVIQDKIRS